ncbi:hypothetical protein DC20_07705 [Rufibacter tibetensis]|uniref:Uncharacterized protein n=1 Tax=Rufibacter tibetensis TaxID=512763 RepID=A0A0P0C1T7_9BACT|nr:hypothetical protein DC20_07705 [Rufibacter tibetensis]
MRNCVKIKLKYNLLNNIQLVALEKQHISKRNEGWREGAKGACKVFTALFDAMEPYIVPV